jgi:hypothetical protein
VQECAKHFSKKLNQCLDELDAPTSNRERAVILSKMLNISKPQARSLIEGYQLPDQELIKKIVSAFEIETKWLIERK